MKIFLFVDNPNTPEQGEVAKKLDRQFMFMVDAIHGEDDQWLISNFGELPYIMFYQDQNGNYSVGKIEKGCYKPTMIVSFQWDDDWSVEEWEQIRVYFLTMLNHSNDDWDCFIPEQISHILGRCEKKMQKPDFNSCDLSLAGFEEEREESDQYGFRYEVYSKQNICLAEIRKPHTDLPYTVVLRGFIENGFKYLFTSIYICDSFGVSGADFAFMKDLWGELGMLGEYDLDKMMKEHTKSCFPGEGNVPASEPEVYRKDIHGTLLALGRKQQRRIG